MQRVMNPSDEQLEVLLARPSSDAVSLEQTVGEIVRRVRDEGDAALFSYESAFDHAQLATLVVTPAEIADAGEMVSPELQKAIRRAMRNIESFHAAQKKSDEHVETEPGVLCWRKSVPIRKVGLYIPGGSAPLFSTVLMLAIPARIAGCHQIVLSTPPRPDGTIHPAVLFAASLSGVTKIVKLGGAQAIAAMAYGTESVLRVDKIFGPGNRFVTVAKQLVASQECAIDFPAGPSEVMVAVDCSSDPAFVAADMLSQAEHGPDSQAVLVVLSPDISKGSAFIDKVDNELELQKTNASRLPLIESSLSHSRAFVVKTEDRMVDIINMYGPEHLIIATQSPENLVPRIENAGSVFLGKWSPESAGDYASGTNHTLPTAGWASAFSGVSVDSFVKKITFQRLSYHALSSLGSTIETMAEAESLSAHARAVSIRLENGGKEESR